jgi:hypothetical protein
VIYSPKCRIAHAGEPSASACHPEITGKINSSSKYKICS